MLLRAAPRHAPWRWRRGFTTLFTTGCQRRRGLGGFGTDCAWMALLPPKEVAEVVRLVRLTATHSPTLTDGAGHLLCDADLAILGAAPGEYSRYLAGVRTRLRPRT